VEKGDRVAHQEENQRSDRVDYDPSQNGCHIKLFLSCSGGRAINETLSDEGDGTRSTKEN